MLRFGGRTADGMLGLTGKSAVGAIRDATDAEMDFARKTIRRLGGDENMLSGYRIGIGGKETFHLRNTKQIMISRDNVRNMRAWADELGHVVYDGGHGNAYKALQKSKLFGKMSAANRVSVNKTVTLFDGGIDPIQTSNGQITKWQYSNTSPRLKSRLRIK